MVLWMNGSPSCSRTNWQIILIPPKSSIKHWFLTHPYSVPVFVTMTIGRVVLLSLSLSIFLFLFSFSWLVGLFRGAAHSKCNIAFQQRRKVPVFFHNGRKKKTVTLIHSCLGQNFDFHLILDGVNKHTKLAKKLFGSATVKIIPKSMEKFLIIDFGQLVLKDTFAFLSSSLDKLVKTLKAKGSMMIEP